MHYIWQSKKYSPDRFIWMITFSCIKSRKTSVFSNKSLCSNYLLQNPCPQRHVWRFWLPYKVFPLSVSEKYGTTDPMTKLVKTCRKCRSTYTNPISYNFRQHSFVKFQSGGILKLVKIFKFYNLVNLQI